MSGRGGNNALLDGGGGCYYGDCVMKMITDLQFGKVREASTSSGYDAKMEEEKKEKKNDVAELVWWFSKSSEQYRVRGRLRFVGGGGEYGDEPGGYLERERRRQWGNLSDMAREQFYWGDPGVAYSGKPDVPAGGRSDDGTVLPLPHNFLLMLLIATCVDYLRLTDNYHQVDEWQSRGGGGSNDDNEDDGIIGESSSSSSRRWKSIRVNP